MNLNRLNSSIGDDYSQPDPDWYAVVYGKEAKLTWTQKLKRWLRPSRPRHQR